jgi:hypothetical protein
MVEAEKAGEGDPVAEVAKRELPSEHSLDTQLGRLKDLLEKGEEVSTLVRVAPKGTRPSLLALTGRRLVHIRGGFASVWDVPLASIAYFRREKDSLTIVAEGERTRLEGLEPPAPAAAVAQALHQLTGLAPGVFRQVPGREARGRLADLHAMTFGKPLPGKVELPAALAGQEAFRHLASAWRGQRGLVGATDRHFFFLAQSGVESAALVLHHDHLRGVVQEKNLLKREQLICAADKRYEFRRASPASAVEAILTFLEQELRLDPESGLRSGLARLQELRGLALLRLGKEPKELEILHARLPRNERVAEFAWAELDGQRGLVALTDRQVVFARERAPATPTFHGFALDSIHGCDVRKGLLAGSLTLAMKDGPKRFRLVDPRGRELELARRVRAHVTEGEDGRA